MGSWELACQLASIVTIGGPASETPATAPVLRPWLAARGSDAGFGIPRNALTGHEGVAKRQRGLFGRHFVCFEGGSQELRGEKGK